MHFHIKSPVHVALILALAGVLPACSRKPTDAAKGAEPVLFKAQSPIAVTLTLLKAEGQIGRSSAIGSNYRPQVRFPLGAVESTCAVQLPQATPSLEPGQSASASLLCESEVRVQPGQAEFTLFEGGKQVGQGAVRLP